MHDLEVGRVYGRRVEVIAREDAAACARLMGEPEDGGVPLGMAFVLALRALMDAAFLPGGAIMAGHRVRWERRPELGERLATDVRVLVVEPARARLLIGYETRDQAGGIVIAQEQDVRWPRAG